MYSVSISRTEASQMRHGRGSSYSIGNFLHIWTRSEPSDIMCYGVGISTVPIMPSIWLDLRPMMARSDSIHSRDLGWIAVCRMAGMISGERPILESQMSTLGGMSSLVLEIAMSDGVSMHSGEMTPSSQKPKRSNTSRIIWDQTIAR